MNDWLVIPLASLFFALAATAVLAVVFGAWLGTRKLLDRIQSRAPTRLRRS
jgi:hypothetical protein